MANLVRLRRSAQPGKIPTVEQLELGELAINTHDGKVYLKKDDGAEAIVEVTGGGAGGGIEEAPLDGQFYVRQNGQWVNLKNALDQLGVPVDEPIDGGNYTTGFTAATSNTPADGGDFSSGDTDAENTGVLDGGNYSTGQTGSTVNGGLFTE